MPRPVGFGPGPGAASQSQRNRGPQADNGGSGRPESAGGGGQGGGGRCGGRADDAAQGNNQDGNQDRNTLQAQTFGRRGGTQAPDAPESDNSGPQFRGRGGRMRFQNQDDNGPSSGDEAAPQGGLDPRTNFQVTQGLQRRTAPSGGQTPTPTTGSTGTISSDRMSQAAGGNQDIIAVLEKIAQDPEGAKALSIALSKGTTFKRGELDGNTAGVTAFATNKAPEITLELLNIDVVAHEIAHAAYPDMDHQAVYEFGRQVARALGETPVT